MKNICDLKSSLACSLQSKMIQNHPLDSVKTLSYLVKENRLMDDTFKTLLDEHKSGRAGHKIRDAMYFEQMDVDVNELFKAKSHRTKRLADIGRGDTKTLLHPKISKQMAVRVERNILKKIEENGIKSDGMRFATFLNEVVEMDRGAVKNSVSQMLEKIDEIFTFKRIYLFGASELEIVNINFIKEVVKKNNKQKRKLEVLKAMTKGKFLEEKSSLVMIHAHIFCMSEDGDEEFWEKISTKAETFFKTKHAVRIQKLWTRYDTETNVRNIASYVTKCGNELFRLKASQKRDLYADDISARPGGRDVRSLTKSQLLFLDDVYSDLQNRVAGARVGAAGAGRGHEIRKIQYGIR